MAEDTTPETEEPEGTEAPEAAGETGRIHSLADINAKIDTLMDRLKGGRAAAPSARATRTGDPEGVADQVRTEVGKLRAADEAKKRSADRDGRLAALEEKVHKIVEQAPVEYRRVTSYLWGDSE
jgi:hypothetical protein